jgi:2-polyprenyl-6-methoxyphenol hydroxylase-like FAD-dependent oxidoreductase
MLRTGKTEVLVVGAGPVGMVTALLLARNGIEVAVIDQESRTATHTHACGLHPRTLGLLGRIGLLEDVLSLGRRIERIGFFDRTGRRGEINLSELPAEYPFAVVLPQSELEGLLEQQLKENANIKVHWSHRLSDLQMRAGNVQVTIDKLQETTQGYIVRDLDWVVEKTLQTQAAFVVGADGQNSQTRHCLGIEYPGFFQSQRFVIFQVESDADFGAEARVMFDQGTTNVVWPLPGRACRWSFEWVPTGPMEEFPGKERGPIVLENAFEERQSRERLSAFLRERAPWFTGNINQLNWCTETQFERKLARQFGQGRCWLLGDAAHQTGPVGFQSMNAGLAEAEFLADCLQKVLRMDAPLDLLKSYDHERRKEWERLLGLKGGLKPGAKTDPWVREHAAQILPCLPGSGGDVARLAGQLGLDF